MNMDNKPTATTVDVLPLPTLALVTSVTAATLRTLARMINNLADTLAEIKQEIRQEKKEEMKLELTLEDNVEKAMLRLRCDTVCSEDSGIEADLESLGSRLEIDVLEDEEENADEGREIDSETGLEVICLKEVEEHYLPEDGWMVLYDRVYRISPDLLERHPGGREVLAEYLGYDGTSAFRSVGHSRAALAMLQDSLQGILPMEERLNLES